MADEKDIVLGIGVDYSDAVKDLQSFKKAYSKEIQQTAAQIRKSGVALGKEASALALAVVKENVTAQRKALTQKKSLEEKFNQEGLKLQRQFNSAKTALEKQFFNTQLDNLNKMGKITKKTLDDFKHNYKTAYKNMTDTVKEADNARKKIESENLKEQKRLASLKAKVENDIFILKKKLTTNISKTERQAINAAINLIKQKTITTKKELNSVRLSTSKMVNEAVVLHKKAEKEKAEATKLYNKQQADAIKRKADYEKKLKAEELAETKRIEKEKLAYTKHHIKLRKKAEQEYKDSFMGSVVGGTTFGHKLATTAQYATAGVALYAMQDAMRAVVSETFKFDDAIYNNMAVLNANKEQAKDLAIANRALAVSYGGSIEEIDQLSLTLGRAGVALEDVKAATKVGAELAKITGDSFGDSAKVLSTFITNYKEAISEGTMTVSELGDKLAYVANASKMSVEDLGTFANYGLQTAQNLNLTIDTVGALVTSMSNLGINASTIGTQMEKLNFIFSDNTTAIKDFWKILGKDQEEFYRNFKKGNAESDAAFKEFVESLQGLDDESFRLATRDMEINTRKLAIAIRESGENIPKHFDRIKVALESSTQAQIKAMGASSLFERAMNAMSIAADGFATSMFDVAGRAEITDLSDKLSDLNQIMDENPLNSDEYIKAFEEAKKVKAELSEKVEGLNEFFKSLTKNTEAFLKVLVGGVGLIASIYTVTKAIKLYNASLVTYRVAVIAAAKYTRAFNVTLTTTKRLAKGGIFGVLAAGAGLFLDSVMSSNEEVGQLNDSLDELKQKKISPKIELDTQISGIEKAIEAYKNTIGNLSSNNADGSKTIAIANIQKTILDLEKRRNDLIAQRQPAIETEYNNVQKLSASEYSQALRMKDLELQIMGIEKTAYEQYEDKIGLIQAEIDEVNKKYANSVDKENAIKKLQEETLKVTLEYFKEIEKEEKKARTEKEKAARADAKAIKDKYTGLIGNLKLQKELYQAENSNIKNTVEYKKAIANFDADIARLEAKSLLEQGKLTTKVYDDRLHIIGLTQDATNKQIERSQKLLEIEQRLNAEKQSIAENQYYGQMAVISDGFAGSQAQANNDVVNAEASVDNTQAEINALMEKQIEYKDNLNEQEKIKNQLLEKQLELTKNISDVEMAKIDAQFDPMINSLEKMPDLGNNVTASFKSISAGLLKLGKQSAEYEAAKKLAGKDEKKLSKLKQQSIDNEIDGYANIAGAAAGMFEENSKGYEALIKLQQVLQIMNQARALSEMFAGQAAVASATMSTTAKMGEAAAGATASVASAGTGDPYTAPVRVAAMIALMTSVMTMFVGGGSGGGGGASMPSASVMQESKFNSQMVEMTNGAILDRLDRQIELLEIIGLEGTAGRAKLEAARLQYQTDISLFIEEIIQTAAPIASQRRNYSTEESWQAKMDSYRAINEFAGKDVFTGLDTTQVMFNAQNIRSNPLGIINEMFEQGVIQKLSNFNRFEGTATQRENLMYAESMQFIGELQDFTQDYIMSLNDVVESMVDAKDTFKELYDDITGTTKYATRDLSKAIMEVNTALSSSKVNSLPEYLENQIEAVERVQAKFSKDITELFISQDIADLEEQARALEELNRTMDGVFIDGTESALNFLESIELVGEAMVTSRNNIQDFAKSFLDDTQLLELEASRLGVSIADSTDMLLSQFKEMANDIEGLTDEELSYLESAKDELQRLNDEQLELLESQIDAIDGVLKSLEQTIDKLRSGSLTAEQSLDKFFTSMYETQQLFNTENRDMEAFQESLNETIALTSELFKANYFATGEEMAFQQLLAANQLEDMQDTLVTEKDLLQEIADNTESTVSVLLQQLQVLGGNIEAAIASLLKQQISPEDMLTEEYTNMVYDIYDKYDLDKFQTDSSGYDYWVNELMSGSLNSGNIDQSIANAAASNLVSTASNTISSGTASSAAITATTSDAVYAIYDKYSLDQYQTDDSGYTYWTREVTSGNLSISDLDQAIANAAGVTAFADGGIVTAPTIGLIGEAGYNEAVIPLKDPNDPLQMSGIEQELADIKNLMIKLTADNDSMLSIERALLQ